MMDEVERLRRSKSANNSDTFVRAEEIGQYLKAAGMKPTHQELLMAINECNVDEGVQFSVLEAWLKKQVMKRKSKTQNPLLVNNVVGKTTASSYDLLGANHVYGVKIVRDKEHGADVIFKWDTATSTRDENADMYVDRVKMNIAAAKKGQTTAKGFIDHNRKNRKYTSRKIKAKMRDTTRGEPLKVDKTRCFGIPSSQKEAPAIKGLIQSSYNTHAMDGDSAYVRSSGTEKSRREQRMRRREMKKTKMTKGQELRNTKIREALNAKPPKKFALKQFKNIPSRLSQSGSRIVDSS